MCENYRKKTCNNYHNSWGVKDGGIYCYLYMKEVKKDEVCKDWKYEFSDLSGEIGWEKYFNSPHGNLEDSK